MDLVKQVDAVRAAWRLTPYGSVQLRCFFMFSHKLMQPSTAISHRIVIIIVRTSCFAAKAQLHARQYSCHTHPVSVTVLLLLLPSLLLPPLQAMSLKYLTSHSRKCPACGMATIKNEGCNKITCGYCRAAWCWKCQQVRST
jgi:hypothetical protein